MKKFDIDAADIYEIVCENFSESDIIEKAMKGFVRGSLSGICVFDMETQELRTRSEASGEYVQDDTGVVLYVIEQNTIGDETFSMSDWLTNDEIADWKENYPDCSTEDYIVQHTDDTLEDRLENILEHYFDWDFVSEKIAAQFEVI
ncbi:MAG TPA: hypothetical protein VFD28_00640 [Candidatus Eisenbacteria bacterium]|nr:hypothetical protein [Candidatus Eisenbacteria bacterium]